ncbi:uncharacterized protein EI90DRAFT_3048347 [Cantharellus anzutake]|uniref:uncharacterized protein n=1 Tax=Cantharellus anzutake TaxID=1750568 RepID=UPI001903A015|nr:uncharacterized protein EI90DRAFT_3048337 [Cantharellus anzutake]XP_038918657.1 uncharacterized protein EI90DRAFT_3048347 [Cantharellus anzutake]KAF8335428.1 hypothetical protein EI90DRAFT_3048337 [Cantharellus anzutake]KAF8335434.1 hypothetical protein EI90DRAFT_3048347 [Cantharellus anzutake]
MRSKSGMLGRNGMGENLRAVDAVWRISRVALMILFFLPSDGPADDDGVGSDTEGTGTFIPALPSCARTRALLS